MKGSSLNVITFGLLADEAAFGLLADEALVLIAMNWFHHIWIGFSFGYTVFGSFEAYFVWA